MWTPKYVCRFLSSSPWACVHKHNCTNRVKQPLGEQYKTGQFVQLPVKFQTEQTKTLEIDRLSISITQTLQQSVFFSPSLFIFRCVLGFHPYQQRKVCGGGSDGDL